MFCFFAKWNGDGRRFEAGGQAGCLVRWKGTQRRDRSADLQVDPRSRGGHGKEVWPLRLRAAQRPCSDPAERHPGARRLCSHLPGVVERPLGKAPPHLRRWPAGPIVGLERLHWKPGADTLEAHPASEQSLCCTGWSPYTPRLQFPLISALEARPLAVKIHCPGGLAGRSWS